MRIAVALCLALCLASTAAAGFVASGNQLNPDSITVYSPVGSYGTSTGMFQFTVSSGQGPNGSSSYYAFCIDLSEYLTNPDTYNFTSLENLPTPTMPPWQPMGTARANYLRELFGRHYGELFDGAGDIADRQAFQLAVWEIIYELDANNDPNFSNVTSGNFRATGLVLGVDGIANGWLSNLDGTGPLASLAGLESLNPAQGYGQDFVTVVPAPAAALLAAFGVSLAGWIKRRVS